MKRFLASYTGEKFDVIVVGGGITGSAVAYDAASRGLKTALLEKNDFGWATSAATSKLIHGGLRYLSNMEFSMVRESLKERRILENIAPNFVYPLPFMVPNYRKTKTGKWIIRTGLFLYDLLSYDKDRTNDPSKSLPSHKWISREKLLEIEPNVRSRGLTGGSIYYDCQSICPERLTLAFVKSAFAKGASVANYAAVNEFIMQNGRITGVKVQDKIAGKSIFINGSLVINCGGPWADIILNLGNKINTKHHIKRSEGIHIITPDITNKNAMVLVSPKGRHFFIIPWRGYSLIGTTDREYTGDPDSYRVKKETIEELISEVNESYGSGKLKFSDVLYAYGGLRPLLDRQTSGTYESSRKYEIYDNSDEGLDGLFTVEGGKYTTSRNLAQKVVDLAIAKLGSDATVSDTQNKFLFASEITDLEKFFDDIKKEYSDFPVDTVETISRLYGTECHKVFEIARKNRKLSERLNEDGEIAAQAVFAVRNEMAYTLQDILFRRTGTGTLGHPGAKVLKTLADTAAKELGWDTARKEKEISSSEVLLRVPQK